MSYVENMKSEPWRFDFLAALRYLERCNIERPRIGDSATLADDYVRLGQDPYMDFPAANLSKVEGLSNGSLRVLVRFLGLLGPQGALPIATTEEVYGWHIMLDDAFPRFLDLINHRYLQLFFRAWANSRPIAHNDRPQDDRFKAYIGSTIGLGIPALQNLDTVPDSGKLGFAGIMACQTKSASRLRNCVRGLFGVDAEVFEFIGTRLEMAPEDRTHVGGSNSRLGDNIIVGATCFSVEDKFRIRLYVKDMDQYVRFLPTGDRCEPVADLLFFYVGETLDWELELALPTACVEPMKLGTFGQIGWTTWLSPTWSSKSPYRCDARFHPADHFRQKRRSAKTGEGA